MINKQQTEKWIEQIDGMLTEVKIQIDKKNYPSEIIPLMIILGQLGSIRRKLSVLRVIILNKGGIENEV